MSEAKIDTQQAIVDSEEQSNSVGVVGPGLACLSLTVVISLTISALFDPVTYQSWVSLFFVGAVPTQIVMVMVWHLQVPKTLKDLTQPLKGAVALAIAILAGLIVGGVLLYSPMGQGVFPPTPMLIMYQIISVPAILWMLLIMQTWPLRLISANPLFLGVALILLSYLLAVVIFYTFYDYGFLQGTPVYVESLDPKGLFDAWTAQTFLMTTVAWMFVLMMFDYWPISLLPGASRQPFMGVYGTTFILVFGALTYWLFVHQLGWDRVQFLVAGPISFIFGFFVVNDFMRGQAFMGLPQPLRGIYLSLCALLVAFIMHTLYSVVAPYIAGSDLLVGAPTYEQEIWVATALLGVTFPLIIVTTGFFEFWPVRRTSALSKS